MTPYESTPFIVSAGRTLAGNPNSTPCTPYLYSEKSLEQKMEYLPIPSAKKKEISLALLIAV